MRGRARFLRRAATAAAMGLAVAGWGTTGAGAETARSVVATARAQGLRATYTMPDYVVVSEFFDGGGPVTESVADSTGRATSFSSLPWPGENAVTAPGLLSVALGQSVPLAYPFYVRADHPTVPSAEMNDPSGSYSLSAAVDSGRAVASGAFQGGGGVTGSRAASSALLDDGGVVRVVAETVDTGISVGDGALRIASVRSRSETVLGPGDAAPVTTTALVVEGASAAGQPVTIDAEGIHAAESDVALPLGPGVGSENQLGPAGFSARIVPTGVAGGADALVITSTQTLPLPNNPEGTLVIRFGGAASEIVVGSAEGPVDVPTGPGVAPVSGPPADAGAVPVPAAGPGPPAMVGPALAAAAAAAGPLHFDLAGGPLSVPGAEGLTLKAAPDPPEEAMAAPPLRAPVTVRNASDLIPELQGTVEGLYPLLGLGGVMLVAATRMRRWRRVRL